MEKKNKKEVTMIPDEMMFEVLGRVPLKSLCICKCVSKSWRSIVIEFLKFYKKYRLSLVLSIRDGVESLFSNQRYLLASASSSSTALDFTEWLSVPYTKYYGVTQAINGLVCFYVACRVCLFNLSTGDLMKLPLSHHRSGHDVQNYRYFFGFDPKSTTYKLLKLGSTTTCEILNLGPNMSEHSWKTIDFPFKSLPGDEAVCVAGTLYWLQPYSKLISFDLNHHSFDTAYLPWQLTRYIRAASVALHFRGCLAFAYTHGVHFYIFFLNGCRWANLTFQLPTELIQHCNNLIPFGTLPTGEIMLVEADRSTPIYLYDPESSKFETFVVGKFPPFTSKLDPACLSCFQPNFNPLHLILEQNSLL